MTPDSPLTKLIQETQTPYHTDVFIKTTLNFKPTQTENILRSNYNAATSRILNSKFDGDESDYISLIDVYGTLFPDADTFIAYIQSRTPSSKFPIALAYIISRKAAVTDKRIEIHELALDEMRSILSMPNSYMDPITGLETTDHKTLTLKTSIFKHLDAQNSKQVIHNQNIEIKLQLGNKNHVKNPTLIGYGDSLPHTRIGRRSANQLSTHESKDKTQGQEQSPKQILDDIINDSPDNQYIDVTPKKAQLMKEDEEVLKERLESLREEEAKAMHIPRVKGIKQDDTF